MASYVTGREGRYQLLLRRAPEMPLEPLHHRGIDTLEIGAPERVASACNAQERRGHARPGQRRVHRLPLDDWDGLVGVAMHDERRSSPGRDEAKGEYCAASASVNAAVAGKNRLFTNRTRSVGGKYATTAATRLDSLSTASEADGSPESAVVPSSSASCPPALPPNTPMRLGSTAYLPAC